MACLFCDQTPETANAVEKLKAIETALGVKSGAVVDLVNSMVTDRNYWIAEASRLARDFDNQLREARAEGWRRAEEYARTEYARIGPSPRLNRVK